MAAEHCRGDGSMHTFKSNNYKISTHAKKEWGIVLGFEKCPAEDMVFDRRIPSIDALLKEDVSVKAKLTRAEVIAAVLYSGPMVSGLACNLVICPESFLAVLRLQRCTKEASCRTLSEV
jgi:hypothetical protein